MARSGIKAKHGWVVAVLIMAGAASAPPAVAAQGLPGGATSLQETHGKWALTCRAPATDGAAKCAVSQTIFNKASRRRVLAISLSPEAGGGVKGALAMPFGLALAKGVTLQIDGGAVATAEPFYTCLPAGCLVSINWPEATVKALRSATVLKLAAAGLLGRPAEFALTMTGFGGALDRAIELGLVK